MNIQILDSWLRTYLETNATPRELANTMSLSGPSFERVDKMGNDSVYDIEVTTNRVDSMSVYGIAREALAILPQYGFKAAISPLKLAVEPSSKKSLPLTLKNDPKLCARLMGVVVENIKNWESPSWLKKRLEASGMRSLNSVVDITNYVMLEVGHPSHAFDYDLIKDHTIQVRESKKGERIVSLEDIQYVLPGGDVVFSTAEGEIFDLPGIIGTKNSVVNKNTKRVLFFLDSVDPKKIRRSSMALGIRTIAATLNEKGVDPELAKTALLRGLYLFEEICGATPMSKIYDEYSDPYRGKSISLEKEFVDKRLGISIKKETITRLLSALEFSPQWKGDSLSVGIPSFRSHDIDIPEDIVEEVARIYGYQNLPNVLMEGALPVPVFDTRFRFESNLRSTLRALGGTEILTSSLVSKNMAGKGALNLKNPLGADTEYLRVEMEPSLVSAATQNASWDTPFHLFEIANVYLPRKNALPEEVLTLAGIFSGYEYRDAKGVLEELIVNQRINHPVKLTQVGECFYYEYKISTLEENQKPPRYVPIPKYPPQVEDITLILNGKTAIGEILTALSTPKLVTMVSLLDIYENAYTFRIHYQHPEKTLSDSEVKEIREKLLASLIKDFKIKVK